MHRDVCEARLHKDPSEEVFALRSDCLQRQLAEMRSLVGVLTAATESTLVQSSSAPYALSPLSECADVTSLRLGQPPNSDPAIRAEVQRLRTELAAISALDASR